MNRRVVLVLASAVVASVGVFLMVRAAEGQVAMDFLAAIERGDLDAAEAYTGGVDRDVTDGPAPDWPWHPERIVEVSDSGDAVSYHVTVAVSAMVAGERFTAEIIFGIGATRRGGDYITEPWMRPTIAVEGGPMVISVAGTTRMVDEEIGVDVLPGVYMVTGTHPVTFDGTRGFLPAPPPTWDAPALVLGLQA